MKMAAFAVIFFSCRPEQTENINLIMAKVEIRKSTNKFQLYVDNEPFEIKGAGIRFEEGKNYQSLKEAGANSFRTWSARQEELDSAAKYGFMVALGLDIQKELHHFDYDDEAAVQKQLERLKKQVDQFKNHPNLLCWVAGNELNLLFDEDGGLKLVNPKTYTALKELVDYIHEVDPDHPVTTTFAGPNKKHIEFALTHCPDLDFLSIQVYGDLGNMSQLVADNLTFGKPYMITEYGATGHWEMPETTWGREIEEPDAVKARGLEDRIHKGIVNENSGLQIGNYVFYWGQKQERTPTWYGMFNKSGEAQSRVDVMTKFWTGAYPKNRAPLVEWILLNDKQAEEHIYLSPGQLCEAKIEVSDPNQDSLRTEWIVLEEVVTRSQGGAFEQEPPTVSIEIMEQGVDYIKFKAPTGSNDYRLFAYTYDGKGKVGNANIPFYVK